MSLEADEKKRELYFARTEKAYEREVAKVWKDALDDIRVEMAKIYEKYAVDGILTKAQMTQYNRLATLERNIIAIVKPAARMSTKIIDRLKPEEYGEAFFRTGWAIDNATTLNLKWGALNKDAVEAILANPFFDSAKRAFWFNVDNRVYNAINNGLATGQSYAQMMRDLKDMINRDNYEIMRVLRTELHDAQEAGTTAGYDEALAQGIEGKVVWLSTIDGRTRDSHMAMDNIARDDDGMFRGAIGEAPYPGWEGLPPEQRINCRCDVRFELEGISPESRRSDYESQPYDVWINDKEVFK
jgi:SPP1 gp7 family putative phage head morphogenesis protein